MSRITVHSQRPDPANIVPIVNPEIEEALKVSDDKSIFKKHSKWLSDFLSDLKLFPSKPNSNLCAEFKKAVGCRRSLPSSEVQGSVHYLLASRSVANNDQLKSFTIQVPKSNTLFGHFFDEEIVTKNE